MVLAERWDLGWGRIAENLLLKLRDHDNLLSTSAMIIRRAILRQGKPVGILMDSIVLISQAVALQTHKHNAGLDH